MPPAASRALKLENCPSSSQIDAKALDGAARLAEMRVGGRKLPKSKITLFS